MKFTTVSPQTRIAFETKMAEVLEICRQKSGKDIPSIPLKFSQMGTRAGVCHCKWTSNNSSFNLGVITSSTFVMYFTYCQLWIPVVAAAFYDDFIIHRAIKWAKTERYQVGTA